MRYDDCPERLAAYIESRRYRPFSYGGQDCCLFGGDWIIEATGEDPAAPLRGYTTQEEADALIAAAGGIEALVTSLLGDSVHPSLAGRGDLCSVLISEVIMIGICLGGVIALAGAKGLHFVGREYSRQAWVI